MTTHSSSSPEQPLWFYADANNQPQGPITFAELHRLVQDGVVNPATLVIAEGGQEWVTYSTAIEAANPVPAPTQESEQGSAQPAKPGINGWFAKCNKQSVWVVLIVVASLVKIGAEMIAGSGNSSPATPRPVAVEAKAPIAAGATSSVPPMLQSVSAQSKQAEARRAARMKVLPISLSTLNSRLADTNYGGFRPGFLVTRGEGKGTFKAKIGMYELVGDIDEASGKLAGVTALGSASSADGVIWFTATVLECISPNQFIRGDLGATVQNLVRQAAIVPGNGVTTVIESDERGFRLTAVITPEPRKVFISIEPAEIYVNLR